MRGKVLVVAVLVVCMASLGSAKVASHSIVKNVDHDTQTRQTGTVGNLSVALSQTGPLAADVTVSFDTSPAGASYYTLYQSYDAFLVYGQIYDYPWIGACHTSTSSASCNDFISGAINYLHHDNSNHYSSTFSFTVPVADTYQGWGIAYGGWSPGVPWNTQNNSGFWITTYNYSFASGNTAYIDANTPTPNPDAGGAPIPTLNWLGILAMIAMMAGVAMLLVIRRK